MDKQLPICKYSTPIIVNTSCLCTRNIFLLFQCPSMVSVLVSCRQFPEILKCLVVHLSHTCGLMGSSYPFCVQKRSLHCGFWIFCYCYHGDCVGVCLPIKLETFAFWGWRLRRVKKLAIGRKIRLSDQAWALIWQLEAKWHRFRPCIFDYGATCVWRPSTEFSVSP